MGIQSFDSIEEMFNEIREAQQAADARVKPWQAAIKHGDFFVKVVKFGADFLTIYGEIIESPNHMKHYRLSRCFSVACPEGEMGDVHVSTVLFLIDKESFELARLAGWPSLTRFEMP